MERVQTAQVKYLAIFRIQTRGVVSIEVVNAQIIRFPEEVSMLVICVVSGRVSGQEHASSKTYESMDAFRIPILVFRKRIEDLSASL